MSHKHNLSRVKTGQNRLNILTSLCFSCQSFVVKSFFFPLSKDRCDGLLRINGFHFPARIHFFQHENCHHTILVLDVLKATPN